MSHHRPVKDEQLREWTVSKSRHAPKPQPIRMLWDDQSQWYSWVPEQKGEGEVLRLLQEAGGDPCYVGDLALQLGESQKWVRSKLKKLKDEGRVKTTQSRPAPGGGTTGVGYRMISTEDNDNSGLSL